MSNLSAQEVGVTVDEVSGRIAQTGTAWQVWPQPAHQYLNIQLPESPKPCQLRLISQRGELVRQVEVPAHMTTFKMALADLKPGLYILQSLNSEHPLNRQILIQ